jgi:hypothetical protein
MRTLVLALLLLLPIATQNPLLIGRVDASLIVTAADRNPQASKDSNTDLDDEQRRVNFAPIVFVSLVLGLHSAISQRAGKYQVQHEDLPPPAIHKLDVVLRI